MLKHCTMADVTGEELRTRVAANGNTPIEGALTILKHWNDGKHDYYGVDVEAEQKLMPSHRYEARSTSVPVGCDKILINDNCQYLDVYPRPAINPNSFRIYDADGVEYTGPLSIDFAGNIVDLRDKNSIAGLCALCDRIGRDSFHKLCAAAPGSHDGPMIGQDIKLVGEFPSGQYSIKYLMRNIIFSDGSSAMFRYAC